MSKTTTTSSSDEEPKGKLTFLVSQHLKKLSVKSPAVKREFFPSDQENCPTSQSIIDPLLEDEFTKTRGLVHKYTNRVLILLTMSCAAYCRFCTRRRAVSDIKKGQLTKKDVDQMVRYLKQHPEVYEVIFSGGDPVTAPELLIYGLKKIGALKQIKVVRVHTRVPVSNPKLMTPAVFKALSQVKQPLYLSVHFEHPDEITPPTVKIINRLRKLGAILVSQSVFLRGVNDRYETLLELFTKLSQLGVRPYYIYRCDPTQGVEHFIVPFQKEVEIMTKLRSNLSGIACPTYVVDAPNGAGKIPVPLDFWQFKTDQFTDFNGKKIKL